ncbi:tetratricopeptide repeat protein [Balneola vulgaris]|uniref:tetratricopeptide repeat protein n=1 Tax=Balneola vulgaris TaxID=287535 RepID=UPI00036B2769|nr:tetratricopeptide repeat protein [Balneola vulgaris]
MTELEYINEFQKRKSSELTEETISLINQAVKDYPNSEKLWILRGDLLQLIDVEIGIPLEESLNSYKRALEINPDSSEANFEMASFLNNVLDQTEKAHMFYQKAKNA